MLKTFKNIFFFNVVKTKNESLDKPKKEKLLLLIHKSVSKIRYFKCIDLIDCHAYTFLFMHIMVSDVFI